MPEHEHDQENKLTLEEVDHELRSWLLILSVILGIVAVAVIYLAVFSYSKHYQDLRTHDSTHGRLNQMEDSMKMVKNDLSNVDKRQDDLDRRQQERDMSDQSDMKSDKSDMKNAPGGRDASRSGNLDNVDDRPDISDLARPNDSQARAGDDMRPANNASQPSSNMSGN